MNQEKINLYCDIGSSTHDFLVDEFKKRGIEIKVIDSGRETPIIEQRGAYLSGIREINNRYFIPRGND